MTTITRNEAARWHTSREARIWAATGDPAALQAHTVDAAESSRDIERLLDYLAVMSAVAQLSDPDQRLLALRYGEDLTYSEVATRLGTAEGTAKVRLHRLRRRLRVALEP